ncbi:exosome complex exonuclease MTR3-like protein [Achlya hypogyna]|uniref:Exosome complex exonuclease MTR3-like protein n=1 Tax=Achlya hypogyna TaxID=1202772 RepID=A0A1V9YMD6_ACHHY|nr:exosome complex exonuclease MTR3-like protein [Achlya hypogyna]
MQNCYFPQRKSADPTVAPPAKTIGRPDARGFDEFRPCFMRCGVLSKAAGSAYVEFGRTRVVCAVYGPRAEVPTKQRGQPLLCEIKLPSSSTTLDASMNDLELEYGNLMRQALAPAILLEKLPKCQISVHAVVLESDGGDLSAAITCASLALVDAGVEMIDVVAACSAGHTAEGIILLDPTTPEAGGNIMVAFMPARGQITHVMQKGGMAYSKVQEAIELCSDGCAGVLSTMMRTAIVDSLRSS